MLKLFFTHIFTTTLLLTLSVGIPVYSVSELLSGVKEESHVVKKALQKARGIDLKPITEILSRKQEKPVKALTERVSKVRSVLDFTPKFASKTGKKEEPSKKIIFKEVKKSVSLVRKPVKPLNIVNEPVKPVTISNVQIEENIYELSFKNIEEEKPIEEVAIAKVSWKSFSLPKEEFKKAIVKKNIIKSEDRISTIASAQEKSPSLINNKDDESLINETTDELVFFDYTEDGKVNTKEVIVEEDMVLNESPKEGISKSVEPAKISALVSTSKILNTQAKLKPTAKKISKIPDVKKRPRIAESKIPSPSDIKKLFDSNSKGLNKGLNDSFNTNSLKNDSVVDYSCLDQTKLKRDTFKNEYSISLNAVALGTQNFEKIHNFEIRFQDDIDDIAQDFGEGEITLSYKLNTNMNIRRGVILAQGYYPTVMDFVFEGATAKYSIPVFEREKFGSIISNLDVPALGAHLLVELDDATEDVELDVDTKYDAKIFLDGAFNMVDRTSSDYEYIMFIGVTAGNTIINYRDTKNRLTNKIVHLSSSEIYYEPNFYAEVPRDNISFYEEGLRSKCPGLLDIQNTEIKPWSFEGKITKKSLNTHSVGKMLYPLGTRKYFELNHLDKSIYVGKWSEEEVVVPDAEYADNILNNFEVADGECLVQLNISKSIKNLDLNSLDTNGYSQTEVKYLDRDGIFYENISDKTNRIFIHGESQGIVNIKLDYTDGSSQFVQTFCSNDTYIVEQL